MKVGFGFVLVLSACHGESESRSPAQLPGKAAESAAVTHRVGSLGTETRTATAPNVQVPRTFSPERVHSEGRAMGTHIAFVAYTTPSVTAAQAQSAFDRALTEIRRIEALMTTWQPTSEVSQINAAAGGSAVHVGDETFGILRESVRASALSEGSFDITFQTLHGLWKFDEDLDPHPPSEAQIRARLPFVGYQNIRLDEAAKTVSLRHAQTQIGLGGIAKGYAVDRAVAQLEAAGLSSFFVQAGGDLFARGKKPGGTEWQAGVRDPRGPEGAYFATLPISDRAFSTAGDYERSYLVAGKRYHHILDPRTGHPAGASRSVTIWAPTALLADEIDDAVFILGPKKGLKLVESLEGVGAVIVDANNNLWVSERLRGVLRVLAPPTEGI